MRKLLAFVSTVLFSTLLFVSCLSPQDPSVYNDEDVLAIDSEKIEDYVKKSGSEFDSDSNEASDLAQYEAHVFSVEDADGGFGYNILKNGKLFIHQTSIPSVQGTKSFSSHEKAMRAAELVLMKLAGNESGLPTISKLELDSLGLLN